MNTKLTALFIILFSSLNSQNNTINLRLNSDPDQLHLTKAVAQSAISINSLIFGSLAEIDRDTNYKLTPYFLKDNGKITLLNSGEYKGGLKMEFEIKDEAKWDNGSNMTGYDVEFTLKSILNPKCNCEHVRAYFEWIDKIEIDPNNPKKYTIYSKERKSQFQDFATYYILPEYHYDSARILRNFTFKEFYESRTVDKKKIKQDERLLTFSENFNSDKYQRDPEFINGGGPYKLVSWTTGQEIVLVKKKNWWGEKFKELRLFNTYSDTIYFKIINDNQTSIVALKDGKLDAMTISINDYLELKNNKEYQNKFNFIQIPNLTYSLIYMNLLKKPFKNYAIRKAISLAIDKEYLIKIVSNGSAEKTTSFIHNSHPFYLDDSSQKFDIELANNILDSAGIFDTDKDGIREYYSNDTLYPLNFEFNINAGNEQRYNLALIFQENLRKIGIKLIINKKEWTVFLDNFNSNNFDMMTMSYLSNNRTLSLRNFWTSGGEYNKGWTNEEANRLIDQFESEFDFEKQKEYITKLQKIIQKEIPVVFLTSGYVNIVSKKNISFTPFSQFPHIAPNEINHK